MENSLLFIFPDWEARAYDGFERNIKRVTFSQLYLINYEDGLHAKETSQVVDKIRGTADENGIKISYISLSKNNSIENWNHLEKLIFEMSLENVRVYIDITTMPREIIWMMLYNLRKKVTSINYFYHKPQSYNQEWLTREPDTPRLLFKHSGIMDPIKQTALLVIPGFDSERVTQLVNFFDPKKVILGVQSGDQFNNHLRNNGDLFRIEVDCEMIELNAYADDMGFSSICNIISKFIHDYNVVIASLGPKLTALSMYKIYLEYPEVALSYIPCRDFNLSYSLGTGEMITGIFKMVKT